MQLSDRLEKIIEMAGTGDTAADIGTDHGYVPIELVRRGHFRKALAMDVRKGPLERAEEHIRTAGLKDQITTRLSDGLAKLSPGEADTIIIAGMGGPLMETLLTKGEPAARGAKHLILSPQSEVGAFHRFILSSGYKVEKEVYLEDENKVYVVMDVVSGEEEMWDELELLYGKQPLEERSPVLMKKLEKEIRTAGSVAEKLRENEGEAAQRRLQQLMVELTQARAARDRMAP